jgi:hypothetical protein
MRSSSKIRLTPWAVAAAALVLTVGCQLTVDLGGLEDRHCGPKEKSCPNGCVPNNDPSTGCALIQCAPCAPPHAKAGCGPNGQCVIDGCVDPWKDCNQKYDDGCEIDLAHDAYNCATCNHLCPKPDHGIAGCSEQMCTIGGCNPGWENCDDDESNGCEHAIWTDQECLTCDLPCPTGMSCAQGACI